MSAVVLALLSSDFGTMFLSAQQAEQNLEILFPEGGEYFDPGDTVVIRFDRTNHSDAGTLSAAKVYAIDLSVDNGATWERIFRTDSNFSFNREQNINRLLWVVPDVRGAQCRLRLVQIAGSWNEGRIVHERIVPDFPEGVKYEGVIRGSDSLMVVNLVDRLAVLDPWDEDRPVRVITWPFEMTNQRLHSLRFSGNDSLLYVGTIPLDRDGFWNRYDAWQGVIRFWTGDTIRTWKEFVEPSHTKLQIPHMPRAPSSVDMLDDGSRVLRCVNQAVLILDAETGDTILHVPNTSPNRNAGFTAEYSPDETRFVTGDEDAVVVRDATTFEEIWRQEGRINGEFVDYSYDGRYILVTPGLAHGALGNRIGSSSNRILSAETGDTIRRHFRSNWRSEGHVGDGEYPGAFAASSYAFSLQSRAYPDLEKNEPTYYFRNEGVTSIAVSPSGAYYVVLTPESLLRIYDMGFSSQPGDTMSVPFSISGGVPIAVDADVKAAQVQTTKDTIVYDFLRNPGRNSIQVNGISIVSGDVDDFELTSGSGSFEMTPDSETDLGVRFSPSDTGVRSITVRVDTENGSAEATIRGFGFDPSVGVESGSGSVNANASLSLAVHPNPARSRAIVVVNSVAPRAADLEIYDVAGRLLEQFTLRLRVGQTIEQVDLSEMPSGTYRLSLRTPDEPIVSRQLLVSR